MTNVIKNIFTNNTKTELDVFKFRNILLNSKDKTIQILRKLGKFDHHNSDISFNEDLSIFLHTELDVKIAKLYLFIEEYEFSLDLKLHTEDEVVCKHSLSDKYNIINIVVFNNNFNTRSSSNLTVFKFNIKELTHILNNDGVESAKEYILSCYEDSINETYTTLVNNVSINNESIYLSICKDSVLLDLITTHSNNHEHFKLNNIINYGTRVVPVINKDDDGSELYLLYDSSNFSVIKNGVKITKTMKFFKELEKYQDSYNIHALKYDGFIYVLVTSFSSTYKTEESDISNTTDMYTLFSSDI